MEKGNLIISWKDEKTYVDGDENMHLCVRRIMELQLEYELLGLTHLG